MSILRKILGGVASIVTALAVITFVQLASHKLFPPPPGLDFSDPAAVEAWATDLPIGAYLMVLLSYFAGALSGAFVGTWIAGGSGRLYAVIVGTLVVAGTVLNVMTISHPVWFIVVALAGIPAAAYLGGHLAPSRKTT